MPGRLMDKKEEPGSHNHCHCEERSDAPQGGLSCPFGAIHLLAIRIPCDAKHRPVPMGPERERIATGFALAMTR